MCFSNYLNNIPGETTMDVILQTVNLTKQFSGTRALDNVSFSLEEGEIHALVGENGAGKSTLMNIISGILKPDSGDLYISGERVEFSNVTQAIACGVGYVHQEKVLCPHISVAENVFMGQRILTKGGAVNYRKMSQYTEEVIKRFGISLDPAVRLSSLSVSNQQIVEIARALARNCKILIFDEPTSSLSDREADKLFEIILNLKEKGLSILYISHRMGEIFKLCDRTTVLRDGKLIDTVKTAHMTPEKIVNMMVGREITQIYPEKAQDIGQVLFKVEDLNKKGCFEHISFELKKGEVLGISGLVGAGRSEILKAICSIDKADSGNLYFEERPMNFSSFREAIDAGFVYLTEDRKEEGLFLNLSLQNNISVANLKIASKNGIINEKKEAEIAGNYINKLDIRSPSTAQKISLLSGGNQQKAVLAKWLLCDPKVILLDEPTRGIDVGAKREIYHIIRDLAKGGIGVIMVSSELSEIIGMCDRVLVMHEGVMNGELQLGEITESRIIAYASGL
jgi:ribose transport system ATP-binding protein